MGDTQPHTAVEDSQITVDPRSQDASATVDPEQDSPTLEGGRPDGVKTKLILPAPVCNPPRACMEHFRETDKTWVETFERVKQETPEYILLDNHLLDVSPPKEDMKNHDILMQKLMDMEQTIDFDTKLQNMLSLRDIVYANNKRCELLLELLEIAKKERKAAVPIVEPPLDAVVVDIGTPTKAQFDELTTKYNLSVKTIAEMHARHKDAIESVKSIIQEFRETGNELASIHAAEEERVSMAQSSDPNADRITALETQLSKMTETLARNNSIMAQLRESNTSLEANIKVVTANADKKFTYFADALNQMATYADLEIIEFIDADTVEQKDTKVGNIIARLGNQINNVLMPDQALHISMKRYIMDVYADAINLYNVVRTEGENDPEDVTILSPTQQIGFIHKVVKDAVDKVDSLNKLYNSARDYSAATVNEFVQRITGMQWESIVPEESETAALFEIMSKHHELCMNAFTDFLGQIKELVTFGDEDLKTIKNGISFFDDWKAVPANLAAHPALCGWMGAFVSEADDKMQLVEAMTEPTKTIIDILGVKLLDILPGLITAMQAPVVKSKNPKEAKAAESPPPPPYKTPKT